jgi:O-antigen/teichoic acid export membrane protein
MTTAGAAGAGSTRHVLTLLTGTGLAQLIALAASPLLSRLFAPEDFGVFALFQSVVALLAILATGRYELAIVLPESDDDGWQLLLLALAITAGVTGLSLLVVALGGGWIAQASGHASLAPWLYLLPLSVALTAVVNTLGCWSNRRRQYTQLAGNRVVQSAGGVAATVGLGAAGWAAPGLLLGGALGQSIAAALLGWQARGDARPVDRPRARALAQQYLNFPRINLPHALLDALQASALLAVMGAAFGSQVLGWYAFALRIARTPLAMLGASIGQVFQQRAAQLWNEGGDLAGLARSTSSKLALFALPFVALMLFAPDLFAWAFGAEWREAGAQARLLTPWMVLSFLTSPLSQLPLVVGQQGWALAFGVAYQVSMLLPYVLAWALKWDITTALALQSGASSVVLSAYGVWLHRLAGMRRLS